MQNTSLEQTTSPPTARPTRGRPALVWVALLALLALLASACGGSDDDGGGNDGAQPDDGSGQEEDGGSDIDPDGVMRIGIQLVIPGGNHLDPAKSAVNPDRQWMELVFGTLLRRNAEGGIDPWMAEAFEIVDPTTVSLTIRDGITFTDGSPYDAEAVKAGLLRTLNESSEVTVPSLSVAFKDIADVTVAGNELTIKTKTPQAGELVNALADREGVIVSPKQAAEAPDDIDTPAAIGAGPYTVEEFTDGQKISLRKNPDFWDADNWELGGVEYIQASDGAAQVNGLLSDTLDYASGLPQTEAARLEADQAYTVKGIANDRSYIFINFCSGKPPYDDADARRAVQIGIDRQEVADLVYGGQAKPAFGFWPDTHANYNDEVEDIVKEDPDAAKELLGGKRLPLELFLAPSPEYARIGEVIQSQLKDIGFDVKITTPRDLVSEVILPQAPGGLLIPGSRTGVDKYLRVFGEGQVQALCGKPRPEIVETVSPAAQLAPGDEEGAELFQEAELIIAENAYLVPIVFVPVLNGYSEDRVGGEAQFYASNSQPMLDTFHIKK